MTVLSGIPRSYRAFAIKNYLSQHSLCSALIVLNADKDISIIAEQLRYLLGQKILEFPAWDCLPYDRISPSLNCINTRVNTLSTLAKNSDHIVVTSVAALGQHLPPKSSFSGETIHLKKGQAISFQKFQQYLNAKGFSRTGIVYEPTEYAIRGDIIDFFPSGHEYPYRVDFFGDEIERIREFNTTTQTTLKDLDELVINPVREIILTPTSINFFKIQYQEYFNESYLTDPIFEHITAGNLYAGYEHWLPLFFESTDTLLHYVTPQAIFVEQEAHTVVTDNIKLLHDYYQARLSPTFGTKNYQPLAPEIVYWGPALWDDFFKKSLITVSPFHTENSQRTSVQVAPSFQQERQKGTVFEHVKTLKNMHTEKILLITAQMDGARQRLEHLLETHDVTPVKLLEKWPEKSISKKPIYTLTFPLEEGFITPDYIILSEQDLLGERITRKSTKNIRKNTNFLQEINELSLGDYVVHKDHGIGQYQGLITIDTEQQPHDCLSIIYADNDRLFLPVENLELISRYGSEGTAVELDKLGTVHWQSRKARVKKRLLIIADYLIKLAAERTVQTGDCVDVPKNFEEFCARFPYPETDDQLRAIEDVIEDLSSNKPMDRLICGDVGFGKTEVALRAAFLVAAAGKQVVVVTPTTLLCRQHYQNFLERFNGFGINVVQISRLVRDKDLKNIFKDIADAKANIIIATHAVFSNKIQFADLGLVVVDEEQHFGVKQKEKLKNLKPNVHILTLTATPIPRTLQLALTGVRELSLISTPPIDRLSVHTFVMPLDTIAIKEALLREHHRGGQSFVVVPRIQDIQNVEKLLQQCVPALKVAIAHGQLSARDLETVISDVCDRKYDILLSTNIVESGIDMPWVNTIILYRSDQLGLAQLYQLRGRVGRTKIQAYAYLLLPENGIISETAKKRLEVMQSLDHLGAGFNLASYDMDIRGAGNIVGEEQSGHIKEVGVELYQTLLQEAIIQVRAEQSLGKLKEDDYVPQLNLGIALLIPEDYVSDLNLRLGLYRRLSLIDRVEDIHSFAAELIDRFGKIPKECENLLKIIELKIYCRRLHIEKIDVGTKGVVISFYKNQFKNPEGLLQFIQSDAARKLGDVKLRPDQRIAFLRNALQENQRLAFCFMIVKQFLLLK